MISPLRKKLNKKKWGAAYDEKLKAVHEKLDQERMIVDKGIFGAAKVLNALSNLTVRIARIYALLVFRGQIPLRNLQFH